ncbi:MAG: DUF3307 domain-containing protein [Sphingobacteriaceae bacterium]
MISAIELLLLVKLILAHLLTDFVFQPSSWIKNRIERKQRSPYLYYHAGLTALLAYIFAGLWYAWWLPLVIFITHLLIDIWKAYQPGKLKYFIADQAMHLLILLLVWIVALNKWEDGVIILNHAINNVSLLLMITAYIFVGWPLGIFIGIATEKWRKDAAVSSEGLAKAGMWIGLLERFLILTFILINQYTAIGFLIAAKSILRFSDKENTQKKTEYVLIGTLMSFSVSFLVGLTVKYLFEVF